MKTATPAATPFAVLTPLTLVHDDETPFLWVRARYAGHRPFRMLRWIDDMTARLDNALVANENETPLPVDVGWLLPALTAAGIPADGELLRDRALTAIDEVRATLGVSESTAAKLVAVARNTLASWRRGQRTPYPATVRHLFEVHSVVSAAAALLERDGAHAWFHGYLPGGVSRVDVLAAADGPQRLAGELRSQLFPGRGPRMLPSLDELDDDTDEVDTTPYAPQAFATAIVDEPQVP